MAHLIDWCWLQCAWQSHSLKKGLGRSIDDCIQRQGQLAHQLWKFSSGTPAMPKKSEGQCVSKHWPSRVCIQHTTAWAAEGCQMRPVRLFNLYCLSDAFGASQDDPASWEIDTKCLIVVAGALEGQGDGGAHTLVPVVQSSGLEEFPGLYPHALSESCFAGMSTQSHWLLQNQTALPVFASSHSSFSQIGGVSVIGSYLAHLLPAFLFIRCHRLRLSLGQLQLSALS